MAKPKHDYDSDDFYKIIEGFAMNGFTDAEVANELDISAEVFSTMKNGTYDKWSKAQNKKYGGRIAKVLAHARLKVTAIVRGRYLKTALGGIKTKSKNVTMRHLRMADGTLSDDEEVQTNDGEVELAPNLQALSMWLYHHDPEWRKVERKQDTADIDSPTEHGIDIDQWIKDKVK